MSTLNDEINRFENEGWSLDVHKEDSAELSRGDESILLESDVWGEVKIHDTSAMHTESEDPFESGDPFNSSDDSVYETQEEDIGLDPPPERSRPKIGRGWIISVAILVYLVVSYFLQKGD